MILEERINKVKKSINADIKAGIVPETAGSFSELHDYVDANEYLIEAIPDKPVMAADDTDDAFIALANEISDAVDEWLKRGRK